jgi:hypothetical protein
MLLLTFKYPPVNKDYSFETASSQFSEWEIILQFICENATKTVSEVAAIRFRASKRPMINLSYAKKLISELADQEQHLKNIPNKYLK